MEDEAPLWFRRLEEKIIASKEDHLFKAQRCLVNLTLDQAYELADLNIDFKEHSSIAGISVLRPLWWTEHMKKDPFWDWGLTTEGEEVYILKFRKSFIERPPPKPYAAPPEPKRVSSVRERLNIKERPPWNVEEHRLVVSDYYDSDEEDAFYAMTRRAPPEYPGHFFHHSGSTYDRESARVDVALMMQARATKQHQRRLRDAKSEGARLKRLKEMGAARTEKARLAQVKLDSDLAERERAIRLAIEREEKLEDLVEAAVLAEIGEQHEDCV